MSKIVVFLSFFAIGFWAIATPAISQAQIQTTVGQAEAVAGQTGITTKDLGVENPGILPSSPFYFLKEFARGIRKTFTFSPVKKAELQLQYTNEKAAEIKRMEEVAPSSTDAIINATVDYQKNIDQLNNQVGQLQKNVQDSETGAFLQKVVDSSLQHQQLFDDLKLKFGDQPELIKQLDSSTEKIDAVIIKLPDEFGKAIENKSQSTSTVDRLQTIQIIDKFKNELPVEQQQKIGEARQGLLQSSVPQQEIKTEDAQNAIADAKDSIVQLESQLANAKAEIQTSAKNLLDNSKMLLDSAEKALTDGKIGEAFGQATAASSAAKTAIRMISPAELPNNNNNKLCTLEAKICPDGSAVGRTGPNCEFAACPTSTSTPAKTDNSSFCGGIRGMACPSGYACQLDANYPDAGGKCVPGTSAKSSQ